MDDVKHPRLTKRGRMFWIRAKVPADLKAHYAPKTEIIYSLKTSDPREALERVRIESVKVDQEFATARRKRDADLRANLSDNEIERLAAIHFHTLMEEDEELRMEGAGEADLYASVAKQIEAAGGRVNFSNAEIRAEFGLSQREYDRIGETLDFIEPELRQALARGDTRIVRDDVEELLNSNGIKLANNFREINGDVPINRPDLKRADQLRPRAHKLADLMDGAEMDVLAYMDFPQAHRAKLHSTNPIERLNGEIKRRTEVVGLFPTEAAITRLIGAILLEQSDERAVQRSRTMTLETIATMGDDPLNTLPPVAAA